MLSCAFVFLLPLYFVGLIVVSFFIDQLQAFIAYSKAVSGAYAATFNALNLAGILLSYAIGTHSHHLNKHQNMHAVFIGMSLTSIQFSLLIAGLFHSLEKRLTGWVLIGMSLGFLPFSLLVAGFSHSLDERLNWINTMAYALIGEVLYMAVMCGLLSYYLIDFAQESLVIVCVMVTTVAIIVPPMIAYSRPVRIFKQLS